ncbi:MAG: hypothetical protein KF878_00575 [Planctomycetes bacterium]|nr:hypothetical protein [Planctomycetota bacterium]
MDAYIALFTMAAAAAAGWLTTRVCRRCNHFVSVTSRTLVEETHDAAGVGERTEQCRGCDHHRVEAYSIPARPRSSGRGGSSGASSSRGGGSSFGGGASRGGGGGASW